MKEKQSFVTSLHYEPFKTLAEEQACLLMMTNLHESTMYWGAVNMQAQKKEKLKKRTNKETGAYNITI